MLELGQLLLEQVELVPQVLALILDSTEFRGLSLQGFLEDSNGSEEGGGEGGEGGGGGQSSTEEHYLSTGPQETQRNTQRVERQIQWGTIDT